MKEHWFPIKNLSEAIGDVMCHRSNPKIRCRCHSPLVTLPACCWRAQCEGERVPAALGLGGGGGWRIATPPK